MFTSVAFNSVVNCTRWSQRCSGAREWRSNREAHVDAGPQTCVLVRASERRRQEALTSRPAVLGLSIVARLRAGVMLGGSASVVRESALGVRGGGRVEASVCVSPGDALELERGRG